MWVPVALSFVGAKQAWAAEPATASTSIYAFTVKSIEGKPVSLSEYRGKVLLIVNVASRCGFTPQYKGLEALYRRYKEKGLVVLGFPANDFLWQEPGSDAEIHRFCKANYDVTFPMFSKIHVRGKAIHPLYAFLTARKGEVTWNFNKFLVGRYGEVKARFGSRAQPDDPALLEAIEQALAERDS